MLIDEKIVFESGFSSTTILKEVKVCEFLSNLDRACAHVQQKYALFGGTATNKIYLQKEQRFSEDLDVHLFGCDTKKALRLAKVLGAEKVEGPMRIFQEFYRFKLYYSDEDLGIKEDFVSLDVGLKFKYPLTSLVQAKTRSFLQKYGFYVPLPVISTYPVETLIANKLLALKSRFEGKDYYDLYYLLKDTSFSRGKVLGELHKYKNSFFDFQQVGPVFLKELLLQVKNSSEKKLAEIDPFILAGNRPNWGLLKKDLVRLIKTKIL